MTTANDLVQETQRLLSPVQRSIAVTLNGNYTASATTMAYTDNSAGGVNAQSILPGTVISIDLELLLVTGVPSGGSIPVSGGYLGSTAANHTSGALIYINRRFTDFECFTQINHVLDEMSGEGLWNLGQLTLTFNAVQQAYDLTDVNTSQVISNYIAPISIRFKTPLPDRKYLTIPGSNFEVLPMGSTTVDANFPSGYQLILNGGAWPGQQMIFLFQQGFTHFATISSDAQTFAKLGASMNDIPPMGAMLRMVPPREVQRNQPYSQPDARLATETPPGAISGSVNMVRALYEMRINEEKARLKQLLGSFRRRY